AYNEFTQTDLIKPGTINVFLFIDASGCRNTDTRPRHRHRSEIGSPAGTDGKQHVFRRFGHRFGN
ncbi:MAG: hypothetical protein ACTTK4_07930, partial [Porphyromonas gingivalis]